MATMATVEKAKTRMNTLRENKRRQIVEIENKIKTARAEKEKAYKELQAATEALDEKAYNKAKSEVQAAESRIEMYTSRTKQLTNQEFMSQEESDRVIDSLIKAQTDRADQFRNDLGALVDSIENLLNEYDRDYNDAKGTITAWCENIRGYRRHGETENPVPTYALVPARCSAAVECSNFIRMIRSGVHN